MQIALKNVQAIKDYVFDFPEHGIVEFVGDNSNNKSALERVLTAIVNVELTDEEVRTSLINDFEQVATVVIIKGNKSLGVQIHASRTKTIIQYTPDLNNPKDNVARTLRDGGWEPLIREFGFRSYGKGTVCLQTYPTFGPLPFINTSPTVNCEIVEDATRDESAETFCDNYTKITFPKASAEIKAGKQQMNQLSAQLDSMKLYDWEKYEELGNRLKKCKEVIMHWSSLHLEPIKIVPLKPLPVFPSLHLEPIKLFEVKEAVDFPRLSLPVVKLVPPMPFGMHIDPAIKELTEYLDALAGKCPACGRPLGSGGESCDHCDY